MRPMRRQDRNVTDPAKINEVISRCEVCRLGFCDQGRPYVVPVNFGHVEENGKHVFYFHGAAEGRKVDLVRETGYACLELDCGYEVHADHKEKACNYAAAFLSIIADGPISIVEDLDGKRRGLNAIMAQVTGKSEWDYPEATLKHTCVCRFEAENLSCKEHK